MADLAPISGRRFRYSLMASSTDVPIHKAALKTDKNNMLVGPARLAPTTCQINTGHDNHQEQTLYMLSCKVFSMAYLLLQMMGSCLMRRPLITGASERKRTLRKVGISNARTQDRMAPQQHIQVSRINSSVLETLHIPARLEGEGRMVIKRVDSSIDMSLPQRLRRIQAPHHACTSYAGGANNHQKVDHSEQGLENYQALKRPRIADVPGHNVPAAPFHGIMDRVAKLLQVPLLKFPRKPPHPS